MKYRPEIDGLRAFAVLPVILFHAGVSVFSGGYVGVDVFFVISGYLITTIIVNESRDGRFSILRFYERRARRILPALFLVMAVCLPLAWHWLLPSDTRDFAASLVAVTLFSSNLLFWQQSGYFETAAELRPLLHTWSLAVEEQFYVLFPLLVVFLGRFSRRVLLATLAAIALISLGAAEWGSQHLRSANFFLLPFRAWELLLGALAALHLLDRGASSFRPAAAQAGSLIGLGLLLGAVFFFDSETPFPGFMALVPTVGTVLIILFAQPGTVVGQLLQQRLLVGVGLISYSAYLWHQPLIAFAKHASLEHPGPSVLLPLCGLALLLAYASWRWVEAPFRDRQRTTATTVWWAAGIGSVAFCAIGLAGYLSGGGAKLTAERSRMAAVEERLRFSAGLVRHCLGDEMLLPGCMTSDSPEVLVWGDSYATHVIAGLRASRPGLQIAQINKGVCGPFLGIAPVNEKYTSAWAATCIERNDKVVAWLKQAKSVKYVLLSSSFGQYMNDGAHVRLRDGRVVDGRPQALPAFQATLAVLRDLGVTPLIVSPTPGHGVDVGRCLKKTAQLGLPTERCAFPRAAAEDMQRHIFSFLRDVEKTAPVVWLFDAVCDQTRCDAARGDVLLYHDYGHLTPEGSVYVGKAVDLGGRLQPTPR